MFRTCSVQTIELWSLLGQGALRGQARRSAPSVHGGLLKVGHLGIAATGARGAWKVSVILIRARMECGRLQLKPSLFWSNTAWSGR